MRPTRWPNPGRLDNRFAQLRADSVWLVCTSADTDESLMRSGRSVAERERVWMKGEVLEDAAAEILERGQRGARGDARQRIQAGDRDESRCVQVAGTAHPAKLARGITPVNEEAAA